MMTKILKADRLELQRSDGTRAEVVTRTPAQALSFELTIGTGDWTRVGDVYTYTYTGMLIGNQSIVQVTPKVSRINVMECAKCLVVTEQRGASVVFTAVSRLPTTSLTFTLRIVG